MAPTWTVAEERIYRHWKALRGRGFYYMHGTSPWMQLAQRWRMPIKEVKYIVEWGRDREMLSKCQVPYFGADNVQHRCSRPLPCQEHEWVE